MTPPRHQIINNLISPLSKRVADEAIESWERLADKLIFLIGEDGFDSVYARSIYLNQAAFPGLVANTPPPQADSRFAELKRNLEEQTLPKASEANCLLLITFTDTLAALIGEKLTNRILQMAWSMDISNSTTKENQE